MELIGVRLELGVELEDAFLRELRVARHGAHSRIADQRDR
jgi:hypothetical protein